MAELAVSSEMSVRTLEQRVRETMSSPGHQAAAAPPPERRPITPGPSNAANHPAARRIEDDLRKYLQTDVKLHLTAESKGTIEVSFYSTDDLERVLDLILRDSRRDF
jgi:ParB family chromosome partitioning protein